MFYTFDQNNSGGQFIGPNYIIIEADSAEEANTIAQESAGVYFNGCEDNIDCECCGDRWYPVSGKGKKKPLAEMYPKYMDKDDCILIIFNNGTKVTLTANREV